MYGNFLKKEVVRWLDCEAAGPLPNADYIDERGFFVGNHHFDITDQLMYLHKTLSD